MTRLVDLTDTMDPAIIDKLPDPLKHLARVFAPKIQYLHPDQPEGKETFCQSFNCQLEDLPDGEGWGVESITDFSSHCGTHVDAPLHSGSTCGGEKSRTITEISLDELYRPGIVLDVRPWARCGEEITVEMLDAALEETGGSISQGDAVLIRTGQERFSADDAQFYNQPGMSRQSTLHLIDKGAKILGTDAIGWDLPFPVMSRRFQETGDKSLLWDGHKAIVSAEAFIVQQLVNLKDLPAHGFMVGFFPIKLANCSAAPARVVAFI